MKIGPSDIKPASTPPTASGARERGAAPAATSGVAGAEPSAKVELSSTAGLASAAPADPTFDSAKVDRIAQAIHDGKFEVNAEAIADKLIVNAAELLGRKSS